jgi:hypothetical protein
MNSNRRVTSDEDSKTSVGLEVNQKTFESKFDMFQLFSNGLETVI